jgi:hypothetical protein
MKTQNILAAAAGLAVGYFAFRKTDAAVGYLSNKKWYAKEGQIVDERSGRTLAVITNYTGDSIDDENAKIMAAGPSLYNALKSMVNLNYDTAKPTKKELNANIDMALSALSEAKL